LRDQQQQQLKIHPEFGDLRNLNLNSFISTMHKSIKMNDEEVAQVAFQLFSVHGCLNDEQLISFLTKITEKAWDLAKLNALFNLMNQNLRFASFEIRTLVVTEATGPIRYHAMLNIADDFIAKEYGSPFPAEELKTFTAIVEKLLWCKKMSTADIMEFVGPRSNVKLQDFLQHLLDAKWFVKGQQDNYYYIGPRSYLELRNLLEQMIENPHEEYFENDDDVEIQIQAAKQRMPQIILH
jgi:hypothetical protein